MSARAHHSRTATLIVVALLIAAVGSVELAARASAPQPRAADQVVWWDDFKRETLVKLMQTVSLGEPTLTGELPPMFETPEPVRSVRLGFLWPVRSYADITSGFGYRRDPVAPANAQFHHGLDIRCNTGEAIRAAHGGRVLGSGVSRVYGNWILVEHAYGFRTFYGHLSRVYESRGARVERGDTIGACGATGRVTGPHLHFEVHHDRARWDPLAFLP